jgi:hypothetical protein
MTELTLEQVDALRAELPETDYNKILARMDQLKTDSIYAGSCSLVAIQEHERERELALINLALRRYGSHD